MKGQIRYLYTLVAFTLKDGYYDWFGDDAIGLVASDIYNLNGYDTVLVYGGTYGLEFYELDVSEIEILDDDADIRESLNENLFRWFEDVS